MNNKQVCALFLISLGLFSGACRGDDPTQDQGDRVNNTSPVLDNNESILSSPVAKEDFAGLFVESMCAKFVECCDTRGADFSNEAECVQENGDGSLFWEVIQIYVNQPADRTVYDAQQAGRLIARMAQVSCDEEGGLETLFESYVLGEGDLDVEPIVRSTRERGSSCEGESDFIECPHDLECIDSVCSERRALGASCQSSGECAPELSCRGGACKPRFNSLALGDACENDGACSEGLRCFEGVCAPLAGQGEACDWIEGCADGLTCISDQCVPLRQQGQSCEDGFECLSTLTCVGQQCVPRRDQGDTCRDSSDCIDEFVCHQATCVLPLGAGEECYGYDSCQVGTSCEGARDVCLPLQGTGQPCGHDSQCEGLCIEGRCGPKRALGEACLYDTECASGMCHFPNDVCIEPKPDGGACNISIECASDYCTIDGVCEPLVAQGEACSSNGGCASHNCTPEDVCGPALADGAACIFDRQCASGWCTPGSVCEPLRELGEACDYDTDCVSGLCMSELGCTQPVPLSQPCKQFDACGAQAFCGQEPGSALCEAQACEEDTECPYQSFCESGTCAPERALGAACEHHAQCLDARCVEGVCEEIAECTL